MFRYQISWALRKRETLVIKRNFGGASVLILRMIVSLMLETHHRHVHLKARLQLGNDKVHGNIALALFEIESGLRPSVRLPTCGLIRRPRSAGHDYLTNPIIISERNLT